MSTVFAGPFGANVSERAQLPPSLAISTVIFALKPGRAEGKPTLWLPLVRRVKEPFKGQWALPGGPLTAIESLEDAARRNLRETTGLAPEYLEQLYAFGGLERASRPGRVAQRVVSIVYWALVRPTEAELLAEESENVAWHRADTAGQAEGGPGDRAPDDDAPGHHAHGEHGLAFDHREIIDYALWRLRNKLEYAQIAYHFLGETFTLAELREVYEAVLGRQLDPANFRRQLKSVPQIEATDQFLEGGRHRPPRLYRYTGPARTAPAFEPYPLIRSTP